MVSSIGFQLSSRKRITGFGYRKRRPTTGRGIVRRVIGSVTRPVLGLLANKIADAISGGRVTRRRRGGSYKLTGMGRRPRRHLGVRRAVRKVGGYKRRPKSTLGVRRRRRVLF